MKFKNVLAAFSGSGKKQKGSERRVGASEENASPLVPKRLLSPMPASSARRGGTLSDMTTSGGTVRGARCGRLVVAAAATAASAASACWHRHVFDSPTLRLLYCNAHLIACMPLCFNSQPRALNYDCSPPRARLQRDAGLAVRGSPRQVPTAAATPARTPARMQSRFGQQAVHDAYFGAAGAAATDHSADASAGSDNIRVVLRVRPRNEREANLGGGTCVQPLGNSAVRVASHPEPHSFSFDYVAGDGADQETMFQGAGGLACRQCHTEQQKGRLALCSCPAVLQLRSTACPALTT